MIGSDSKMFLFDPTITGIKIISIIYVSILYASIGLILTYGLDKFLFNSSSIKTDDKSIEEMTILWVIITTVLFVGCLGVVSYIGRNLIQMIPFPFEGVNGFEYMRVKEVASGGLLLVFLIAFSQTIAKKYKQIKFKLNIT